MRKNFPERINERRKFVLKDLNKRLNSLPLKYTNNSQEKLEGEQLQEYRNYLESQISILKSKIESSPGR